MFTRIRDNTVSKLLEDLANVAIVIAALCLCVTLARGYLHKPHVSLEIPSLNIGNRLGLLPPAKGPNAGHDRLILALSTNCHFCTESGAFYRRISRSFEMGLNAPNLTAVFPQSVEDGSKYLSNLEIRVDQVEQRNLSDLNIFGTPTLVLVNGNGVIKQVWAGKLPPEKESEVIAAVSSR